MEGKEEDVRVGANKFPERQPIGTSAQSDKDYNEPPPAPLFEPGELSSWSFWRAGIAEFIATFLFLYITVLTVMGVKRSPNMCASVGIQGIAWAFGGMIFALVYCTAGISGGHINPAVTFGLFLARKLSLTRALYYIVMQCLGAICGAGVVKGFQPKQYQALGGGANTVAPGYTKGSGLGAEIIGTFVLVYTVFSATDAKRNARDSHVPSAITTDSHGCLSGYVFVTICADSCTPPNRFCSFLGSLSNHPNHWHRHQPSKKSWSCNHLQQRSFLGRPLGVLGWTIHWCCTCCSLPCDCH
ncbi:unnamed protein product [Brassica rapa subsp. trilocularis]